jgi:hypothetical protein
MCCQASTLVSTALNSRVAVLPCAVAVYPRRRLFSVAVCVLARCAARLLNAGVNCALALQCCRVQSLSILGVGYSPSPCVPLLDALPGFLMLASIALSRCSAAVCSCCLSSASAALRRRVCPRSMRCQASKCWCQLRSRVAVLPCAVAVYPRRRLCSPSPCALARCAARLLCWRQLCSEMLRGCSRAGRGRRGWETILICVCDGELPLRVCEITPAFKCEGLRAVGPSYPGGRSRWLGRCSGDLAGSLRQARTYGSERTETLRQTHGISSCVGSCVRAFTK